jgi:hypothetical protein
MYEETVVALTNMKCKHFRILQRSNVTEIFNHLKAEKEEIHSASESDVAFKLLRHSCIIQKFLMLQYTTHDNDPFSDYLSIYYD